MKNCRENTPQCHSHKIMLVRVAQLISGPSQLPATINRTSTEMKSYVWDQKPQTGKGKWFVPVLLGFYS